MVREDMPKILQLLQVAREDRRVIRLRIVGQGFVLLVRLLLHLVHELDDFLESIPALLQGQLKDTYMSEKTRIWSMSRRYRSEALSGGANYTSSDIPW